MKTEFVDSRAVSLNGTICVTQKPITNSGKSDNRNNNKIPNNSTTMKKSHTKATSCRCTILFDWSVCSLFVLILIVNVQLSCGLIEIPTEREKPGK